MKLAGDLPVTCLITRGEATDADPASLEAVLNVVRSATADGVSIIQIREKQLSAHSLFELVSAAATITAGTETKLLVNDRPDIAIAAKIDGVHLTSTSLPVESVRKVFGNDIIIGVSVHSAEEAFSAADNRADLVLLGPIFATPGKGRPLGTTALKEVAGKIGECELIALGGIDHSNCRESLNAGASGVAAIRSLNEEGERQLLLRELSKWKR